jgi:hypothetical protein
VLAGDQHAARVLLERLATAYRAALLVQAGEEGSERQRHVAGLYVEGFLAPAMERVALDLGDGYGELVGL